jgi:prolyl 4-hydroxylase
MLERGGQRIITVIMYLNSLASAGGETYFPYLNLKIEPMTGRAIVWYNVDENGEIDRSTFHEARPVEKGEKWIATKWLREHKFK